MVDLQLPYLEAQQEKDRGKILKVAVNGLEKVNEKLAVVEGGRL